MVFLDALRLFQHHEKLRGAFWRPLIGGIVAWIVVAALGAAILIPAERAAAAQLHLSPTATVAVGSVVYIAIWLFFAGPIYIALVSTFSSFLFEDLSRDVEEIVLRGPALPSPTAAAAAGDGISRLIFAGVAGLGGLCCGAILPGVGAVLIAGLVGLIDFTANSMLRRRIGLVGQLTQVWRLPGWPSFLLISGVIALVPLLNVLLLPVMVAAGTLLVVRGETVRPPQPVQ